MSRVFRAAVLLLFLASCGGGSSKFAAPRDLDNACSVISERPQYFRAMQDSERKWGVPVPVQMATIYQESKFVGNARTPHRFVLGIIPMGRQSTAYGYSQALDGTWEEYQAEQRNRSARRDRIEDATDFMGWYMYQTEARLGVPRTDASAQYLAYHEGRTGYANGSHKDKPWLLVVADQVEARAVLYSTQLQTCS